MKKNGLYIFISLSILISGAYFLKKEYDKRKELPKFNKPSAIEYIIKSGKHSNSDFLKTLGEKYLIAWADAVFLEKKVFDVENKQYLTQGGKSI